MIVNGFVMVKAKTETKSDMRFDWLYLYDRTCLMVFLKNIRNPSTIKIMAPTNIIHIFCSLKKSETNVRPNPAMLANNVSAAAAPNPDTKPESLPRWRVRCMHNTPTGPIGIDTNKPIKIPCMKRLVITVSF